MHDLWVSLGISFDEPIRDPLWRNVMVPPEFASLLASPDFIKLSRILQLGPTHLVYPGATHTRLAHSIGVFELGKRTLAALASRGKLAFVDTTGARSFLVATLCHDVGHFPYAHSLKELPLAEHESLTAHIVQGPLRKAVLEAGADPDLVAAIVDQDVPAPNASCLEALSLYRSMLSGVLDPDKLDYLNRDAWACGVPYGQQDVDFILQHLGLDASGRPGVSERGVMAVESVLFSKYQMYRAVYWHKSVRAATAMIKKAVIQALSVGNISPEDLYGLDDHGFYHLMFERSGDPHGLIQSVFSGSLYRPRLEIAFDEANPAHSQAANLASRPGMELEIAARAGVSDVIVDVPEPISFESDLPILGTGAGFSAYASVFRPDVVESFTRSLRVLRIFSSSKTDAAAARIEDAAVSVLSGR